VFPFFGFGRHLPTKYAPQQCAPWFSSAFFNISTKLVRRTVEKGVFNFPPKRKEIVISRKQNIFIKAISQPLAALSSTGLFSQKVH
jgi:hypothetical protein